MQAKQIQVIKAIGNVTTFLDAFAQHLPRTNASGARRQLDALAARLLVNADIQVFETRAYHDAVIQTRVARRALFVSHLTPLVAAARIFAAFELSRITLPKYSAHHAYLAVVARDMAELAKPFAAAPLVAAGLASGFVEQLQAAVDAMEQAVSTARRHFGARVTATRQLQVDDRSARRNLRLLDRLARSELGAEHPLLARWDGSTRMPKPALKRPASRSV